MNWRMGDRSTLRPGNGAIVLLGALVALVTLTGCGGGSAVVNTSTAVPARSVASSSTASASGSSVQAPRASPTASNPYPADVPLTGRNVRPGEKPPIYPAAAAARTQDGANAFARFFVQTLDWGFATTNGAYMNHYYGSSCGICDSFSRSFRATALAGNHYIGSRISVRDVSAESIAPVTAPADFCTRVSIDYSAGTSVDKNGNIKSGEGAKTGVQLKLCEKRTGPTSWVVSYVNMVQ
jgi:hypothetical protein